MSVSSTDTLCWDESKHDEVIHNYLSWIDNNGPIIDYDVDRVVGIHFRGMGDYYLPDEDGDSVEQWYSVEPGYFTYSCYCSVQEEPFFIIAEGIQKANPNIEFTLGSWGDCEWSSYFYKKYVGTTLLGEYVDEGIYIFDEDEDERFLDVPSGPIATYVLKKPHTIISLHDWTHDIVNVVKIVIGEDEGEYTLADTRCDNFGKLFEWCKTKYLEMHPELDKTAYDT